MPTTRTANQEVPAELGTLLSEEQRGHPAILQAATELWELSARKYRFGSKAEIAHAMRRSYAESLKKHGVEPQVIQRLQLLH